MNFKEASADVQSIIDSMEAVKGKKFAEVAKTFAGAQPILVGVALVEQGVIPAALIQHSMTLFITAAIAQLCAAYDLNAQEIADASKIIHDKMQQHSKHIAS